MLLRTLIAAVLLALRTAVCIYIWRDAPARGLRRWPWMLAACLLSSQIGLLLYLLGRANHPRLQCAACGHHVGTETPLCPGCGARLRPVCPGCAAPVEESWKLCPYCGHSLEGAENDVKPPVPRRDRALPYLLCVSFLIPLLVFGLMLFFYPNADAVSGLRAYSVDEYLDSLGTRTARRVEEWLAAPKERLDMAYVLCCEEEDADGAEAHYAIYLPAADGEASCSVGVRHEFLSSYLCVSLSSGQQAGDGVFCAYVRADEAMPLQVLLDGEPVLKQVSYMSDDGRPVDPLPIGQER